MMNYYNRFIPNCSLILQPLYSDEACQERTIDKTYLNDRYRTSTKTFVSQDLDSCTHVFVHIDAVRKPLQTPYEGPFPVIRRTRKNITIKRNGSADVVAIDRVKPAYLFSDSCPTSPPIINERPTQKTTKRVSFLLPRN